MYRKYLLNQAGIDLWFAMLTPTSPPSKPRSDYMVGCARHETKLVSIVIPVFNLLDYTKSCLESIWRNTEHPFELIIVDNGSTDGTTEYLSRLPCMVIRNGVNLGVPKAFNQGIRVSSGKHVLILNNDTIVTPDWLSRMVRCAESNDAIGIVGTMSNRIGGPQRDEQASYSDIDGIFAHAERRAYEFKNRVFRYPRLAAIAMLVKRKVFERVGLFEEDFSPGNYEDDDLCIRALLAGFDVVIAQDVFIHHYGSRTWKASNSTFESILDKNKQLFQLKWGQTPYDDVLLRRHQQCRENNLVSVIAPTYNNPSLLEEGVGSVLRQSHSNLEIIVVNDGGENVSSILENFDDSRIVYVESRQHCGRAAALNRGIMRARGKYIAYITDGARFRVAHIETLISALESTSCHVAYANSSEIPAVDHSSILDNVDFGYGKSLLMVTNYIPIASLMHERSLLDRVGLFAGNLENYEDWDLLLRLAETTFFYRSYKTTVDIPYTTVQDLQSFNTTMKLYRKYRIPMNMEHNHDEILRARIAVLAWLKCVQLFSLPKVESISSAIYGLANRYMRLSEHIRPKSLLTVALMCLLKRNPPRNSFQRV
jgi:GT2 family glycosyltransferase